MFEFEIRGQHGNIDEDDVFKYIETEEMAKVQGRNQQLEDVNVDFIKDLRNCLLESNQHEDLSFESMTIEHNQNFVTKKDDILSSHKDCQCLNCFSYDTGVEEIVVAEDKEEHFDIVFDDFEKRKV